MNEGAIVALEWNGPREQGGYYWQMVEAVAKEVSYQPGRHRSGRIAQEKLQKILYGTGSEQLAVVMEGRNDRKTTVQMSFEGVIPNLERRFRETNSDYIRNKISEFMSDRPCPTCKGERLRPEALAVTVFDHNIVEVTRWPVNKTLNLH